MTTLTQTITALDVDQTQRSQAKILSRDLDALTSGVINVKVTAEDGTELRIPTELTQLLRHVIRIASQEQPFSLVQFPDTLTSVEAAKLLDVSRPTLLKWARDERVRSHKVGTHTRFLRSDVLGLARELQGERLQALEDLRDFEDSLGLEED